MTVPATATQEELDVQVALNRLPKNLVPFVMLVLPDLYRGRSWAFQNTEDLENPDIRNALDAMNQDSSIPINVYQVSGGVLIWYWDRNWILSLVEKAFEGTESWTIETTQEIKELVTASDSEFLNFDFSPELRKSSGGMVSVFDIKSREQVFYDGKLVPSFGVDLRKTPEGISLVTFEGNKTLTGQNLVEVLRGAKLSSSGDSLILRWL